MTSPPSRHQSHMYITAAGKKLVDGVAKGATHLMAAGGTLVRRSFRSLLGVDERAPAGVR